ncbi:MAG TPA: SAM-dependent chlorinase/fluorinase [Candidatus Sulfotelmatobacter sp.]|nr:SAM-dependent chlorinase/fluorinase [Candidatus Sulfotelmatobacter sp.]
MIFLFSDFGLDGPYQGQMKAVLASRAPHIPVIDLMADAPAFKPKESAYLLAALLPECPAGGVVLAVVDPGVGGERPPLAVRSGGRWLVGPGNGLFDPFVRRYGIDECRRLQPDPGGRLSASFHGRDLFAPAAARLALGEIGDWALLDYPFQPGWPEDLPAVIYVDHYGNAMTGLRASGLSRNARIVAGDRILERARTFSDRPPGEVFWYENSCGLVEIAVNQGRADRLPGMEPGCPLMILP